MSRSVTASRRRVIRRSGLALIAAGVSAVLLATGPVLAANGGNGASTEFVKVFETGVC